MQEILAKLEEMSKETNDRFDKVNDRFDKTNDRFNRVEESLTQIENIVTQLVTMVGTVIVKQNETESMKKDIVNIQHDITFLSQKTSQNELDINRLKNSIK
jgi:uncharacterized coiled-coil DUF342 family protein